GVGVYRGHQPDQALGTNDRRERSYALVAARREDQPEGVGRRRLVQDFGGDVPASQTPAEAEQRPQPLVFRPQLGQERGGEGAGIALGGDRFEPRAGGAEQLRLALQLEEGG